MARSVRWTEAALSDLESIAEYIGRDSHYYASAFVREIRDAGKGLKLFPDRGRVVPEIDEPDIREIFVKNYRLIYRHQSGRVVILAIIHGARDLGALWRREGKGRNVGK